MKNKALYWIIAILVIFNVITYNRVNRLEDTIRNQSQQYMNEENRLRDEMNQIYSRVNEMLKKQASILDSYDLAFGKLDAEKLIVPVTLTLTPKEYTDRMTASMLLKDKSYDMQRNGTSFSVTADAYIFDDFQPRVNLISNGITKTETIQGYNGLQSKYLLEIFGHPAGESQASSTYFRYHGNINIDIKPTEGNEPVKASIITEVNGKVVTEKPADPSQHISLPADEKIDLKPGDKLAMYAKVQDKYGLNYKYNLLDYVASNDKPSDTQNDINIQGSLEISDRNGKILFEQKR